MVLKPNTEHDVTKTRAFFKGKHNATLLSRGASPDEIGAAFVFPLEPEAYCRRGHDRRAHLLPNRQSDR